MVDSYRAGPRAPPSWVPVYYFQQPTEGKLRQERSQVTPQHSVFLSPWISSAPHPPQRGHLGATREREPTKRGSAGEEWTTRISPSRGISSTPFSPETRAFPPPNRQPRVAQCQAGRQPRPAAALPARAVRQRLHRRSQPAWRSGRHSEGVESVYKHSAFRNAATQSSVCWCPGALWSFSGAL